MNKIKTTIKKAKKTIRLLDPRMNFERFENLIPVQTKDLSNEIIYWSNKKTQESRNTDFSHGGNELVKKGQELRKKTLNNFLNKYRLENQIKVLVHIPSIEESPGGYSLFTNLSRSLEYIGIKVQILSWVGENLDNILYDFRPTIFLTSDAESYLSKIDWEEINKYRRTNGLKVGLTASIEEYGNTPLKYRLEWAKSIGVDFYYSFRTQEYLKGRKEYKPFFEIGYQIFSIPFGANPLIHYPEYSINKDLDYVFLASSNYDKRPQYYKYLPRIVKNYTGCIYGPGWSWGKIEQLSMENLKFPYERDRFIYSRAKIGLNLHIQDSIDWACELNERTYGLAACGIPQLVDNAKLLPQEFQNDSLFIASNPKEYFSLFKYMLNNPDECNSRAYKALLEVFDRHTTFHRAESFLKDLKKLF